MALIHNPKHRRGNGQPHFIDRKVEDVLVLRTASGELILAGVARIFGKHETVFSRGRSSSLRLGAWKVVGKRDIRIVEIVTIQDPPKKIANRAK